MWCKCWPLLYIAEWAVSVYVWVPPHRRSKKEKGNWYFGRAEYEKAINCFQR